MSAAEDESDIGRVLAGDLSSFEGIVRRWQKPLVNLAYRFCHDRGRAEEMAQEAFLRAYRSLHTWRKDAAFSTWFFALATNLYRSEIKRIPPASLSLDEISEPSDPHSHSAELESWDQERALHSAVLALPLKYREVLVLFYFHEMDVHAAALSLSLPVGTVKARLFRAREILRKKLAGVAAQGSLEEVR